MSLDSDDDNVVIKTPAVADDDDDDDQDEDAEEMALKGIANVACKPIAIGAAVLPTPLLQPDVADYGAKDTLRDVAQSMETPYARLLRNEFNAVVVEHHLKWAPLLVNGEDKDNDGSCLGQYDFTNANRVVNWAVERNLQVKGHVLVWHVTSPPCLHRVATTAHELRTHLKRHIQTTMAYFKDRIRVWDVVNEALAPDGSLASNIFLKLIGPSYIQECFEWAHEADPTATLLYNDNKVESIDSVKGEAFYQLLADLKAKGAPIHGCGMQGHFNAAGQRTSRPPTPRQLKQQIHRLGKLGLKVNLSELDVRVSKLPSTVDASAAQTQIYRDLCAAALSEPACDGLWFWGFTDRHTWVSNFYYDDEPLIFDEEYQRKPAYYGLCQALASVTVPRVDVESEVVESSVWFESDFDAEGRPWGYEWIQGDAQTEAEEDEVTGSDARPDWEQTEEEDVTATAAPQETAALKQPEDLLS